MADNKLLIITDIQDTQQRILAPATGYYSERPQTGALLVAGSVVGKLKILNSYYDLLLPQDTCGQVWADEKADFIMPVEYGQELFRLNLEENLPDKQEIGRSKAKQKETALELPDEGFLITAFTTGIFYAKPSPDASPFVTVGQEIEKGKALGLIEVMKTFNHIIFQGTDKADKGRIKKIYLEDAQEVKLGQPLFLVE